MQPEPRRARSESMQDHEGERLVACPYCAGHGKVYEGWTGSLDEAPCPLCATRGVVPAWKRASFWRSHIDTA